MNNLIKHLIIGVFIICFTGCAKHPQENPEVNLITQAKQEYDQNLQSIANNSSKILAFKKIIPKWDAAYVSDAKGQYEVIVPVQSQNPEYIRLQIGRHKFYVDAFRMVHLVMTHQETGLWESKLVSEIPDSTYLSLFTTNRKTRFSGIIMVRNLTGQIISSHQVEPNGTVYQLRITSDDGFSVPPVNSSNLMTICETTQYYSCAYPASNPEEAYCTFTRTETTCAVTSDGGTTGGDLGNIYTGGSSGSTGSGTGIWGTTPPDEPGPVPGEVCGSYNWKKVGDAYYAQIQRIGFSLVNTDGQVITIVFPSLCIQLPPSEANPVNANNTFNNSWSAALTKVVQDANASAVLGEYFVKRNMITYLRSALFNYLQSKNYSVIDGSCAGTIPTSNPAYCALR